MRAAREGDLERIVELFRQLTLDTSREIDARDPAYARAFADIVGDARQMVVVVERALDVLPSPGDPRGFASASRTLAASVDAGVAARLIVGSATLSFLPNLSHGGRPAAQLESVVVDDAERGHGAGEALVRWCLDEARRRGAFRAQLTSDRRRDDAHRFWTKCGFVHTHAGFKQHL